ncbi:MAG: hypothetical protein OEZ35_01835 [Candidatus Bathyarchaeota archaeon]|nr:hypothetical protein [Candidatus Bathyarchaeota archaeon]
MKTSCNRCGQNIEQTRFTFYEVDRQDRKHRLGTFCMHCTTELLDELKGKVEWFHIEEDTWKGYIHPEARRELEKAGFVHPKHDTKYIEVKLVETKRRKIERTDALAILRVKYAGNLISKEEYEKLLKEL